MDTQGIDSEETDAKPVSESAARKAPRKAPISAPAQGPAQLRVAVGIATVGRPEIVVETIARLSNQTLPPARIVVCSPTEKDVAGVAEAHPYVEILIGPRGASVQRNAIIDALTDCDAVVFFDDDFVAAPGYLAAVEVVMRTDETVVMTTGRVLADGINGPGITLAEADEIVAERAETTERFKGYAEIFGGYGCNMAVRLAPLREHQLRFDDKLPLYSWLEDIDLSRRIFASGGRIVILEAACGVHMGAKSGRSPGLRLGYSQVANPIYLMRKGSMPMKWGLHFMSRNVVANVLKSLMPEPYIDRRGRLKGNCLAIYDFARGRVDPERILSL